MRLPRTSSPFSFAKSKQPRPRRRNSSPSVARTRRDSHARCPTMGPQGIADLAAARLLLHLRRDLPNHRGRRISDLRPLPFCPLSDGAVLPSVLSPQRDARSTPPCQYLSVALCF